MITYSNCFEKIICWFTYYQRLQMGLGSVNKVPPHCCLHEIQATDFSLIWEF